MNLFTELVWGVIIESPDFLEELTAIMKQDHRPFSFTSDEKAFQANAKMLEEHVRKGLDAWYDWLPDTPINRIGGGLAVEMLDCVDWDHVAQLVKEHILKTSLAILEIHSPSTAV